MRASSSERSLSLARPRSDPRAAASSAAIIQSGQAKPGAESFGPRRLTRPSMLVVVPARSCVTAHGSTTSAWASTDSDGWPVTATTKCPAPKRLVGHGAVGEVVERVGTEEDEGADGGAVAAPSSASPAMEARMSAVERPVPAGTEPQAAVKRWRPALEADPARQDPGRQSHVERPEDVAPAQRRQEGRLGQRGGQRAHGLGGHLARLGVGGPAGHDHHALAVGVGRQQRRAPPRAGPVVTAAPSGCVPSARRGRGVAGQRTGHERRVARADAQARRRPAR